MEQESKSIMAYFLYQQKKAKYGNKKTVLDGIKFDSKKEASRYQELIIMQKQGIITHLELQKPFVICPKIEGLKGSRARKYIADFVYEEKGKKIIEDVKSAITRQNPVYTLKKQLVQWQYPDYEFREV